MFQGIGKPTFGNSHMTYIQKIGSRRIRSKNLVIVCFRAGIIAKQKRTPRYGPPRLCRIGGKVLNLKVHFQSSFYVAGLKQTMTD